MRSFTGLADSVLFKIITHNNLQKLSIVTANNKNFVISFANFSFHLLARNSTIADMANYSIAVKVAAECFSKYSMYSKPDIETFTQPHQRIGKAFFALFLIVC